MNEPGGKGKPKHTEGGGAIPSVTPDKPDSCRQELRERKGMKQPVLQELNPGRR